MPVKILARNIIYKNFFSLSLLQAVNLLIPLIVTPYLVQVLGLNYFGKITFAASVMAFFVMVADYGFNLYLTKEVALYREDKAKLNQIFTVSVYARVILVVASFLLLLMSLFIPRFGADKTLFISSFCIVLGQSFVPTWIFQGLDSIKPLAIINGLIKVSYIAIVFILIKKPDDYVRVNVLWGINGILCAIVSIFFLLQRYKFVFVKTRVSEISSVFQKGVSFFLAGFSVNIYTFCSSAILGLFASYESVALFGVAEKIIQIIRQPLPLFSQVIYPTSCRKAIEGKDAFFFFMKKTYLPFLILFIGFATITFVTSPLISGYFQETHTNEISTLVRIMIPATFFMCLNVPAYQALLSFGFNTTVSALLSTCSAFGILINLFLSANFNATGTAIHFVITEFVTMLLLHIAVRKKLHQSVSASFLKS